MAKKKLPQKIEHIVQRYITFLKEDNLSIKDIYIYGSYAKGTAHKDSDIDVCVISSDFKNLDPWEYLWKKRLDAHTLYIQPVGFAPEDFVDESPLVWEIKRTGVRVGTTLWKDQKNR